MNTGQVIKFAPDGSQLKALKDISDYEEIDVAGDTTDLEKNDLVISDGKAALIEGVAVQYIPSAVSVAYQIYIDGSRYRIGPVSIGDGPSLNIWIPPDSNVSIYYKMKNSLGGQATFYVGCAAWEFMARPEWGHGNKGANPAVGAVTWP